MEYMRSLRRRMDAPRVVEFPLGECPSLYTESGSALSLSLAAISGLGVEDAALDEASHLSAY
jgi:hypothetical protein